MAAARASEARWALEAGGLEGSGDDERVEVVVLSFNMACKEPYDLEHMLRGRVMESADVVAIGLQESLFKLGQRRSVDAPAVPRLSWKLSAPPSPPHAAGPPQRRSEDKLAQSAEHTPPLRSRSEEPSPRRGDDLPVGRGSGASSPPLGEDLKERFSDAHGIVLDRSHSDVSDIESLSDAEAERKISDAEDGPAKPESPSKRGVRGRVGKRISRASRAPRASEEKQRRPSLFGAKRAVEGKVEDNDDDASVNVLRERLASALGDDFYTVSHQRRALMQLFVFARERIRGRISNVAGAIKNTGGAFFQLPNKGGICLRFNIDSTPLCFISCHLDAHEGLEKRKKRHASCAEILKSARPPGQLLDHTLEHHHVFWFGDLNYRTTFGPDVPKEQHVERAMNMIEMEDWHRFVAHNELTNDLNLQLVLSGFSACDVEHFPPTYKRLRNHVDGYNAKRVPSHTDRVLYYSMPGTAHRLRVTESTSFETIVSSDHKPVRAAFSLMLSPRVEVQDAQPAVWPQLVFNNLAARDLPAMDVIGGRSDPYVRFYTLPHDLLAAPSGKGVQTKVCRYTLSPDWRETVKLKLRAGGLDALRGAHVIMCVYDRDFSSADDLIGCVSLSIDDVLMGARTSGQYSFSLDVVRHGVRRGTLSGTVRPAGRRNALVRGGTLRSALRDPVTGSIRAEAGEEDGRKCLVS